MTRAAALLAALAAHFGGHHHSRATVYSGPCDGQNRTMADGTRLDSRDRPWHRDRHARLRRVDDHIIASTFLHLGTRVRFDRRVFGRHLWTVRDGGGHFDLFRPRCRFGHWNNPKLGFRVVK